MTVDEVLPALLRACPTAIDAWNDHLAWWGKDERGHFNDVGVLAHHIVEGFTSGDVAEFPAFFEVVEVMVREGDVQVQQQAITGLIEDIQNIASHLEHGYAVFERWMQPSTRTAWHQVEQAWQCVGGLADMIRRERGSR